MIVVYTCRVYSMFLVTPRKFADCGHWKEYEFGKLILEELYIAQ